MQRRAPARLSGQEANEKSIGNAAATVRRVDCDPGEVIAAVCNRRNLRPEFTQMSNEGRDRFSGQGRKQMMQHGALALGHLFSRVAAGDSNRLAIDQGGFPVRNFGAGFAELFCDDAENKIGVERGVQLWQRSQHERCGAQALIRRKVAAANELDLRFADLTSIVQVARSN